MVVVVVEERTNRHGFGGNCPYHSPLLTPACLGTRSTLIFHFMLVPESYILRRIPVSVRVQFSRVVLRTVRTLQVESLDGVGYGLWLPESCFECVDAVCANGRNGITLEDEFVVHLSLPNVLL